MSPSILPQCNLLVRPDESRHPNRLSPTSTSTFHITDGSKAYHDLADYLDRADVHQESCEHAIFKGVTTEAVTEQVVAIISVVRSTSAEVDHQVAYFREGRVWYRFDDMNVRHRAQRVECPPLNTRRNEYVQLFLYA